MNSLFQSENYDLTFQGIVHGTGRSSDTKFNSSQCSVRYPARVDSRLEEKEEKVGGGKSRKGGGGKK